MLYSKSLNYMKYLLFILLLTSNLIINAQTEKLVLEKSINQNVSIYSIGTYKKLCRTNSKEILLDSISRIVALDSVECFFAQTSMYLFDSTSGEEYSVTSNWHLYNLEGKKIILDEIYLYELIAPPINENVLEILVLTPTTTKDKKAIILTNNNGSYGVVDIKIGLIVPFSYGKIEISEDQKQFIAIDNSSDKEFRFDRNGNLVK